jgi:hypothetical protein
MSVTLTHKEIFQVLEMLELDLAADKEVRLAMNSDRTLKAASTPPASASAFFKQALAAGASSIDLMALLGVNGAGVNGAGLRVQAIKFANPAANADPITIAKGAAHGYTGLGANFSLVLVPGAEVTIFVNDAGADIDGANRLLDLAGVGEQVLHVGILLGGGESGLMEVRSGPYWPSVGIGQCSIYQPYGDPTTYPNLRWVCPDGTTFTQSWAYDLAHRDNWGQAGSFTFSRGSNDGSDRFVVDGETCKLWLGEGEEGEDIWAYPCLVRVRMPTSWNMLNRVSITHCGLEKLDVAGCSGLASLAVQQNSLTELDLTGCPLIQSVVANDNAIARLTLPASYENIGAINLANNQLSAQEIHRLAVAVAENSTARAKTFDVSGPGNAAVLHETERYLLALIARDWIVSVNGWSPP